VKQGTLGQFYLKQGEMKSAEQYFTSALAFAQRKDVGLLFGDWNGEETSAAEQIALYNMTLLKESLKEPQEVIEAFCIETLTKTSFMDTATTTKSFIGLHAFFTAVNRLGDAAQLELLAKDCGISLLQQGNKNSKNVYSAMKRVIFAIDYSGSMSGTKIRSAVENLQNMLENNINECDKVAIVRFNNIITIVQDFRTKQNNESIIKQNITSLNVPNNTTMLYDAISVSFDLIAREATQNDWIIVLTDGQDSGSKVHLEELKKKISLSNGGIIVIGVGSDVESSLLQSIADASKKGVYFFAEGNKSSMDEAFGQVAKVIQGQVLLEEY
jgi:Mg-chelatase subunit ChlD